MIKNVWNLELYDLKAFYRDNPWAKMTFSGLNNVNHLFFSGRMLGQNDMNIFFFESLRVTST